MTNDESRALLLKLTGRVIQQAQVGKNSDGERLTLRLVGGDVVDIRASQLFAAYNTI